MSTAVFRREPAHVGSLPQTDKELRDKIVRNFQTSPYYALRRLTCEVINGVPVLQGKVSSYYYKQIAQASAIQAIKDSRKIKNRIQVVDTNDS